MEVMFINKLGFEKIRNSFSNTTADPLIFSAHIMGFLGFLRLGFLDFACYWSLGGVTAPIQGCLLLGLPRPGPYRSHQGSHLIKEAKVVSERYNFETNDKMLEVQFGPKGRAAL